MNPPAILIVEDELIVAMDLRQRLEASGYAVAGVALSSAEALEQARTLQPDLVLMDVQLQGGSDGIEASDRLRHEFDLPVIFLTANTDPATLARAKATAPFHFLQKPVKERELIFCIDTALHHQATQRELRLLKDELALRVELRTTAYRAANTRLEDEIARHAETVKALEAARDDALAASRAKSRFLACISHELRTPMNGIIGMTEILLDAPRTPPDQDCLNTLKSSAESMLTLVENLIDYAESESGKIQLTLASFNPRTQIHRQLVECEQRARTKGLQLTAEIGPEVPPLVVGDARRIRQVFAHLLDNAVKFTPRGEIEVQVGVRAREGRSLCLEASIRDTGVGIPREKQRTIFEPFTQADNSSTRPFDGAGLGLTISNQLLTLMNGRLWVKSEPGHGSTFHFNCWVELPSCAPRPAPVAGNIPADTLKMSC
jgi:signal transduction histidine kinase